MSNAFDDEDSQYKVLVNGEEQYSLWPAEIGPPDGWRAVRGPDTRAACLAYIDEHWTDMRPAGLRTQMDEAVR
jgi:MbtH protein